MFFLSDNGNLNALKSRPVPELSDEQFARFRYCIDDSLPENCWNWCGRKDKDGYGVFNLNDKNWRAHRIANKLGNGTDDPLKVVSHTCDNPSCCNPNHLRLTDQTWNMQDKIAKGRQNWTVGEELPQATLTNEQVREIKRRLKSYSHGCGFTIMGLAREFGVGRSVINHIRAGNSWTHINI